MWKYWVLLYTIELIASYSIAFALLSIVWYVYEWLTLGHLDQNEEDTITAFQWAFLLMMAIAYFRIKKISKEVK